MLDQVAAQAAGYRILTDKRDPDFSGLSFAYRFRDGQAEPIVGREIAAALAEPGGWIWIHLSLVDISARAWIQQNAPLPERARNSIVGRRASIARADRRRCGRRVR